MFCFFFSENVNEIVVTWSTMSDAGENGAIVEYGINGFALQAYGSTETFVDGGPAQHTQFIHRVSVSFVALKTENCVNFSYIWF